MKLNEYQARTRSTAVYPGALKGNWEALSYIGLGLGEAGEVQGKLKKVVRDDGGVMTTAKKKVIAAELGDLLWYVSRLADEMDYDLEDIAEANLVKLHSRAQRGVIGGSGDDR